MTDDLMKGADDGLPIPAFIEECSSKVDPLGLCRELNQKNQLDRKAWVAKILQRIRKQYQQNYVRCALYNIPHDRFTAMMMSRTYLVLQRAADNDSIGELRDFARHLLKKPKIYTNLPGHRRNGT